jgi:voltage-gated potassium channel
VRTLERHEPKVLRRPPTEREEIACAIEERLHGPIAIAAVVFVLVILGLLLTPGRSPLHLPLLAVSWAIWALFVVEYVLRMIIAPSTLEFLKHKWWQIIILCLPFLGFLRLASLVRVARGARVLSWSVRATRTAGSELRARLYWLAAVHAIVILGAAEVLVEYGPRRLALVTALHATALGATTGQPLGLHSGFAETLEVFLALYAVAFFASIAGALGAFFMDRRKEAEQRAAAA